MNDENRPLISVVIPTYNRKESLPVAIYSVINQTYENLDIIVIDDGSHDGTEEYIRSITDKRLRYKRSDRNRGPSAARNMGARLALGEYLAFQDSDDEWMPDKLEKQMKFLRENREFSLVYCAFAKYRDRELLGYIPSPNISCEKKSGDLFTHLLLSPLISTQTIVVRRDLFWEENGFNEDLNSYEDYEFSLRFARKHKIGFVDELLVKVNSSPDSVNKRFAERIRTQFYIVQEMLDDLRKQGLLWMKLDSILGEADSLFCHEIFIKEIKDLSNQFLNKEERPNVEMLLQKAERDKENEQIRMDLLEMISNAKADSLKTYTIIYVNRTTCSKDQWDAIKKSLSLIENIIDGFNGTLLFSQEINDACARLYQSMEKADLQWAEQLFLLTDMVELLEKLERFIS